MVFTPVCTPRGAKPHEMGAQRAGATRDPRIRRRRMVVVVPPRARKPLAPSTKRPHLCTVSPPVSLARRPQPWPIRLAHWLNVPALVVMAGSGLQILVAYPVVRRARGDATVCIPGPATCRRAGCASAAGSPVGGRSTSPSPGCWSATGSSTSSTSAASGEWRRRLFRPLARRRGAPSEMALYYLRIRKRAARARGSTTRLQRFAYTVATGLGVAPGAVGPRDLQARAAAGGWPRAFGGYDAARFVHFAGLVLLALFTAAHLRDGRAASRDRSIEMVTGGAPR